MKILPLIMSCASEHGFQLGNDPDKRTPGAKARRKKTKSQRKARRINRLNKKV